MHQDSDGKIQIVLIMPKEFVLCRALPMNCKVKTKDDWDGQSSHVAVSSR